MKKGNLSEDTNKECLEYGEMRIVCLNQQSNMYVNKQGQSGKMDSYDNLIWKQLKDK